jgi:imidazolonepropionase-like amidohydrolase
MRQLGDPEDILFTNARLVDLDAGRLSSPTSVYLSRGLIKHVGEARASGTARVVDLRGLTLMPGLLDCHVHVTAVESSFTATAAMPQSLLAYRTAHVLSGMLDRGFTTVRDMGGADHGLVRAVDEGWISGPRIISCGRVLSQTGGHGDFRGRYDTRYQPTCCSGFGNLARLCDGVDAVRAGCREELKAGASFIKLMANGGCTSPTDPIEGLQYSRAELQAAVEEAENAKTYVAAHLYTDEAIRRAVELGVTSVEHCNLIEEATAALMHARGAFAVPTLITHRAVLEQAEALGLSDESVRKTRMVADSGANALQVLHAAQVPIAYGSDLLGEMHVRQSEQFDLLADVLSPIEVLRSTSTYAARLMRLEHKVGCIRPGAFADLIAVDGDPTVQPRILARPDKHLAMVMKSGRFIKEAAVR